MNADLMAMALAEVGIAFGPRKASSFFLGELFPRSVGGFACESMADTDIATLTFSHITSSCSVDISIDAFIGIEAGIDSSQSPHLLPSDREERLLGQKDELAPSLRRMICLISEKGIPACSWCFVSKERG